MENTRYKFRAWQKYHKRMVEVTSISFDDNGEINGVATFVENQAPQHINYRDDLSGGFFLKDERGMVLELMQYTGLKDKNGVEVYFNDIVEDEYGHRYEVVFEGDCLRCNGVSRIRGGHKPKNRWFGRDLKIIGNIYENSDLI